MSNPIERLLEHDTPVLAAKPGNDVFHIPRASGEVVEMACGRMMQNVAVRSLSTFLRTSNTSLCDRCWPEDVASYPIDPRFKRAR